ncbi:MAG: DUF2788 domain-containing protein [Casimicrobiaceae bacterium]
MNGTVLGFTEAQISGFFLTFGVAAFIAYMLFIILQLAWESKAGKLGTFVLLIALGFGTTGYIAKQIIQWWLSR